MTARQFGEQPAFPVPPETIGPSGEICHTQWLGMALRTHIVVEMAKGLLPLAATEDAKTGLHEKVAVGACRMADALLEQLAKEST